MGQIDQKETIEAAKSRKCEFEECLPLEINDFGSVINEPKHENISCSISLSKHVARIVVADLQSWHASA